MTIDRKSLKVWIITGLVLGLSTASLPAAGEPAAGEPAAAQALVSALDGAGKLDQYACLEIANGAFTVKECLHRAAGTDAAPVAGVALPDSMQGVLGAELQWMKPLFADIFRPGELHGAYTRWTKWGEEEMKLHAVHPFTLHVETRGGAAAFELAIDDHALTGVRGEVWEDGSASLVLTYAEGGVRELLFQDGMLVSEDGLAEKSHAGPYYMGCFIDTPAWDEYRPHQCYRLGSQPSSVSFKVFLPYTPEYVVWSQPSSSCSGLWCTVPISPGQTVYGYAYWVINGTPTGPVSATATYFYEPFL